MENKSIFETLFSINVNKHAEKKNGLTYLSWSFAWAEVKKAYPLAQFFVHNTDGKPYLYDENLGYLITTSVEIEGQELSMFLPVMDGANKAMKKEAYTYKTKFGEKTCEAANMFDINKTIMRCLVKNLAMFGLGLYIYAGEDLPESEAETSQAPQKEVEPIGVLKRTNEFKKQLEACNTLIELQESFLSLKPSDQKLMVDIKDACKLKLTK